MHAVDGDNRGFIVDHGFDFDGDLNLTLLRWAFGAGTKIGEAAGKLFDQQTGSDSTAKKESANRDQHHPTPSRDQPHGRQRVESGTYRSATVVRRYRTAHVVRHYLSK